MNFNFDFNDFTDDFTMWFSLIKQFYFGYFSIGLFALGFFICGAQLCKLASACSQAWVNSSCG